MSDSTTLPKTANPILEAAKSYVDRGWLPIAIRVPGEEHKDKDGETVTSKGKDPLRVRWPQLTKDDAADCLQGIAMRESRGGTNVGIVLGAVSGDLVDVDLDCDKAIALADVFLPPTDAMFGRTSTPGAHRLYQSPGAETKTFPEGDTMLVELRSTGGQTVFPPSLHESGETVTWESEGNPAMAESSTLIEAVSKLAAAALLARHWPDQGSRNNAALALAGALVKLKWSEAEIEKFVVAVAETGGDTEDRARAAVSTARKPSEDRLTGWPSLVKLLGTEVIFKAREWLGDAATPRLDEFLDRYVYVRAGHGTIIDLRTPSIEMIKQSLRDDTAADRYTTAGPQGGNRKSRLVADDWLEHADRKSADRQGWRPGEPEFYTADGEARLNTYRPPAHAETTSVSALTLALEHFDYLIPDADSRSLFLEFLADIVQRPEVRPGIAPLLIAPKHGTGRGWIIEAMGKVLGESVVKSVPMKQLTGSSSRASWDDHLYHSLLTEIPEVNQRGKERYEVDDEMRQKIDAKVMQYNRKKGGNFSDRCYARMLLETNHRDALILPEEDRRLWPMDCAQEPRSDAYYKALYDSIEVPEFGAQFYWWLRRLDTTRWRGTTRAPHTAARARMVTSSRSESDVLFDEAIEDLRGMGAVGVSTSQLASLLMTPGPSMDAAERTRMAGVLGHKLSEARATHMGRMRVTLKYPVRTRFGGATKTEIVTRNDRHSVWLFENEKEEDPRKVAQSAQDAITRLRLLDR